MARAGQVHDEIQQESIRDRAASLGLGSEIQTLEQLHEAITRTMAERKNTAKRNEAL